MLRLPRVVVAILVQVLAAAAMLGLMRLTGLRLPTWGVAVFIGIVAGSLTRLVRLESWWVVIQLLFAPLLFAMLALDLPPWLYLAIFAALALVYWSTFRSRVPLYLSNAETWQAVESLLPTAPAGRSLRFIDLGSGLGGLLCYLAERHPEIAFEGIELAPLPAWSSALRVRLAGLRNLRIRWGSFWKQDLGVYDVVFAFLSPEPMPRLWQKARREMRSGSLFVSCAFEVPDASPTQVIELASPRQPRLLVWRMP